MNVLELLEKYVFWTQTLFGAIQAVVFFISGTCVYGSIAWHYTWMSRDFTCDNATDDDKNQCMGAYKKMELHPLQSGLLIPSLWYWGSLLIWIISGIATKGWFTKFVNSKTPQSHQGCFKKKCHIGVVYFVGIGFRSVCFFTMCVVYLFFHNNWDVSSKYDCKLIKISCSYSRASDRTTLNILGFVITVVFLILALFELLFLCHDNYHNKNALKDTAKALCCEECANFAKRQLIWLKYEYEDAKNDTRTPLIDLEETAEYQDTVTDGPQQPERNYNPTEEKSKKGQPSESDEKPSSSHPAEKEKSHITTTLSDHGSDNGCIQDQLTERTPLLREVGRQKASWDPAIQPDSANSDYIDSGRRGPLIQKKDSSLSDTKSASPKSFTKSEVPTPEDLEGKYVASFRGNVCSRLIKLLDPHGNWEGIASQLLDADAVKKLKSGKDSHIIFFEKLKAEHATMTLADIKHHCNGKRLDIFRRIEHIQQKPDFGKEICFFEDQEWKFVLDKIAKPLIEFERSIFNWKDLARNIGYESVGINHIDHCGKVSNYSPTETLLWHLGTKLTSAQEFCEKVKDCERLDILQYLKKQIDAGTCWEVQEETAEVRGTASGGPQQPERNYNPPEQKPEKDATGAIEGAEKMYCSPSDSSDPPCPPLDSSDPPYVDDGTATFGQSVAADQTDTIPNARFAGAHLNPDDHIDVDGSPGSSNPSHSSSDTSSDTSDADSIKSGLEATTQAESHTDLLNVSQGSYRHDGGPKGTKDQTGENVRPSNSATNSTSKNNSKKEGQGKSGFNGKAKEKVDSKTLNYVAEQIASDWIRLGRKLGVDENRIEQIDARRKCYDKAYEVLTKWLKMKGDDATIDKLLGALKECHRKDIIDEMCSKYKSGNKATKVDDTFDLVATRIESDWVRLGRKLGVSVEPIDGDNDRNCYEQAYKVLTIWWRANGDDATIDKLLAALEGCGRKDISDKIRKDM